MGKTISTIPKEKVDEIIKKEYENALSQHVKDRDYLVLHDLFKLTLPEDIQLNFSHMGNLFNLDYDKDGRFSLVDIQKFAHMAIEKIKTCKPHEIQSQLQAFCSLNMYSESKSKEQEDDFVAWIGRVLYEDGPVATFSEAPGIPFIRSETVKVFYEILNVRVTHNVSFQAFLALLHQAAEEEGLMTLEAEAQDDYVALDIIQQFSRDFIRGFSKLMLEVGFT
eukprot:TRINITY_DN5262_c0_g2_i17.p1 TRINITY_DN5262_c0_g2~~TRINITY_DN5262_c0_g2_i17.p1  ORF type:complete len:222 (+),score=52.42 TRINITY_DN5262_c0_g2_i17:128-793(+)